MTREKYKGGLTKFFNFIRLNVGTMEGRAKAFTERANCNICSQVRLRYDGSKPNANKSLTKIGADKDFYALHELLGMERRAWVLDEV